MVMCTECGAQSVSPLLLGPSDHYYFVCLIAFRYMCQLSVCDFSDLILQISILWLDYIQNTEGSDCRASLSSFVSSFEDPIAVTKIYCGLRLFHKCILVCNRGCNGR